MAAFMTLVQHFLSGFTAQLNTANATAAASVASATMAPPPTPTDPSSLLVLLSSFTALRDWMKLAFLGGLIEMCRRFVFGGYAQIVNSFYITACFEEQDVSYSGSNII
jgi:chaperone BCS1